MSYELQFPHRRPASAANVQDDNPLLLLGTTAVTHQALDNDEQLSGDQSPTALNSNETGCGAVQPMSHNSYLSKIDGSPNAYINGYLSTALILFTLITNCLVCIVLLKRHMRTSPTNVLLIALSVSTTLTGIWPVACNVHFYILGNCTEWLTCSWSIAHDILVDYLPTIFHTSSIWLTVALAVQRYIIVCQAKATAASRWSTVNNVIRVSAFILVVAFMSHGIRFFEHSYDPVTTSSMLNDSVNVSACIVKYVPFVAANEDLYFSSYYFFRIVFINCLPCLVLVLLNAALINTMKTAEARRKILIKYNRRLECRRLAESNATTLMLVTVVGVFLLVEFPMAIMFVTLIITNTFCLEIFDEYKSATATMIVNLLVQFSYLINFFIYCSMSRQFRDTFKSLFVPALQSSKEEQTELRNGLTCTTRESHRSSAVTKAL